MNDFSLNIASLPSGISLFEYDLDKTFFGRFNYDQDFEKPELHGFLEVDKKNTMLSLKFNLKGDVILLCDITGKEYTQQLISEMNILVKFGDFFDDSDDEILVLPFNQDQLDLSQFFYDMTLLSIPQKRYHPDLNGDERNQTIEFLQDNIIKNCGDPRWDALKKIKDLN